MKIRFRNRIGIIDNVMQREGERGRERERIDEGALLQLIA